MRNDDDDQASYSKKELLLKEYERCNDGYNSRDHMVLVELSVLLGLISGLTSIVVLAKNRLSPEIEAWFIVLLGILGWIAILALSVDLQSTHSTKVALRRRMETIELKINYDIHATKTPKIWHKTVESRNRYFLERWFKFSAEGDDTIRGFTLTTDWESFEREIHLINLSIYGIVVMWFIFILSITGLSLLETQTLILLISTVAIFSFPLIWRNYIT